MKFTEGNYKDLTDKELIYNIAFLKSGIDTGVNIQDPNAVMPYYETELKERGFDEQDINIKVEDAIKDISNSKADFWGKTDRILGTASNAADVFGKFKGIFDNGASYVDDTDGSEYDIKPKEKDNFNYKPYIIGGVGFIVIVSGILFLLSRKGNKK